MRLATQLAGFLVLSAPVSAQCLQWSALEQGVDEYVRAFGTFDDGAGPALYVGGDFAQAFGAPGTQGLARWDGSGWSAVGTGFTGWVWSFEVADLGAGPGLYVGGNIVTAGGLPANDVARWDGASWSTLGGGVGFRVQALQAFDDGSGTKLFAGGYNGGSGGLVVWDGTSWSPPGGGVDDFVRDLAVYDDGGGPALYATGAFDLAGGVAVQGLAKWDGTSWSAVPGGTWASVLTVASGRLFVGGGFTSIGGIAARHIASWDGSQWEALGTGVEFTVYDMAVHDDGNGRALYAGGDNWKYGPMAFLAKWDGASWSVVGGGTGYSVLALHSHTDATGPALYAGGAFGLAGGQTVNHVGRWGETCSCISTYCTAGTSSGGCQAWMTANGQPSATAASGFQVTMRDIDNGRSGMLFFGTSGAAAVPWGAGSSWMCVQGPRVRTGVQKDPLFPGLCHGRIQLDFNAWMAANPTKAPGAGQQVWMQGWYRDPPSRQTTSLSDGLTFFVCP